MSAVYNNFSTLGGSHHENVEFITSLVMNYFYISQSLPSHSTNYFPPGFHGRKMREELIEQFFAEPSGANPENSTNLANNSSNSTDDSSMDVGTLIRNAIYITTGGKNIIFVFFLQPKTTRVNAERKED